MTIRHLVGNVVSLSVSLSSVDSRPLPPPPRPRPISVLVAVPLPRQRAVPATVVAAAVSAPGTPIAAVTATKAVGSPEQQTRITNHHCIIQGDSSGHIWLTLIWEFYCIAYMPGKFCQIVR